jgi:twinkle protein
MQIKERVSAVTDDCRIACPSCSETRKKKREKTLSVTVNPDGSKLYFCHHCGESGSIFRKKEYFKKESNVTRIQPRATVDESAIKNFFNSRGILWSQDIDLPVISGKRYFNGFGELDAVGFVYGDQSQPSAIKWRAINQKAFTQEGAARHFYGIEFIPDDAKELIIVEGECDALALASAGIAAVSCPNGAPQMVSGKSFSPEDDNKFSYIWEARELIDRCDKIILATDNDKAGHALAEEIARRIGRAKCWAINYPAGCKDANEVIQQHGVEALKDVVSKSQPLPLKGVYSAKSYIQDVQDIFAKGVGSGESTGIASIDDLFTIAEGQLSVVTGVPSSGKSEFVDQIMVNLAQNCSWKFAVASFENPPHFHIAKLSEKIVGKAFFEGEAERMTNKELTDCSNFIDKHFVFLDSRDGAVSTIDSIIDRAKQAVMRLGIRGLVIDPYNYIEKNTQSDESQSISSMLTKVTAFAKAHGVHVWFIAHPAKMYPREDGSMPIPTGMSISGSAAWFAKADLGVTVHRVGDDTEIHCWKSRFKWIGKQGAVPLAYDKSTGRYSEWQSEQQDFVNPKHWTEIDVDF